MEVDGRVWKGGFEGSDRGVEILEMVESARWTGGDDGEFGSEEGRGGNDDVELRLYHSDALIIDFDEVGRSGLRTKTKSQRLVRWW